jgi:hypothetical protein
LTEKAAPSGRLFRETEQEVANYRRIIVRLHGVMP